MGQKYKKKYKLKVFPIVLLCLIVLSLGAFFVFITLYLSDDQNQTLGETSSTTESVIDTGGEVSKDEEQVSSEAEIPVSSQQTSSQQTVSKDTTPSQTTSSKDITPSNGELPEGSLDDFNLILVNRTNKLDGNMSMDFANYDGENINAKISSYYEAMAADAKADGITLFLRSGYRNFYTQQLLYERYTQNHIDAGKSQEEALELANRYSTPAGTSEHHTGLALDIVGYEQRYASLNASLEDTEAFQWLLKNAENYGFILRYVQEKYDITKIYYEPWHFRYVGVEHAKYMNDNDLCLEEYIELRAGS